MKETAVEFIHIRKTFADRIILDGISLCIHRGEFFALLGPSGSGKSTLLKLISGIETPDQGDVLLGQRVVTSAPPHQRPVHTVFQNYALFPHLNVAENVAFPLRVAGVAREIREQRVQRALGWVKMERFARQRVQQLSGGERQRVALARALVDDPEVVLLDEPLSALDPHLRGQTLELLQETQTRLGATYVFVTHDREEALRAAHRIGVLNGGRLEQVGTPEELYHHPATPFVAGFIGPIHWLKMDASGRALANGTPVPTAKSDVAGLLRVGVRPEQVRLGEGFLHATVEQRTFAGASVSLRLATECGSLVAEIPGISATPSVGEKVNVGWDWERVHLFGDNS